MAKRVHVVIDNVDKVLRSIKILTTKQVLIGIPEENSERSQDAGDDKVTNAMLAYVHETGSPDHNIPARPFLVPGVRKALPQAVEALKIAATASLDGDDRKVDKALNVAGIIASGSAKREISTASYPPLADATIARRSISRGSPNMNKSEKAYFKLREQGMDEGAAQAAVGIQPLVNTGQLRNAITYVVRDKS
jgi:hypothetical protein